MSSGHTWGSNGPLWDLMVSARRRSAILDFSQTKAPPNSRIIGTHKRVGDVREGCQLSVQRRGEGTTRVQYSCLAGAGVLSGPRRKPIQYQAHHVATSPLFGCYRLLSVSIGFGVEVGVLAHVFTETATTATTERTMDVRIAGVAETITPAYTHTHTHTHTHANE